MPYDIAINKAWERIAGLEGREKWRIKLLNDTYDINLKDKTVISCSCPVPAKDYVVILLLHYLIGTLKKSYTPCGQWVSFKEVPGGEVYYPAFHKSVLGILLIKYGQTPENLLKCAQRFNAKSIPLADAAIELVVFDDVSIRVLLWKQDSEFSPEANILFDKNLTDVYAMEDIVVFLHFVASSL